MKRYIFFALLVSVFVLLLLVFDNRQPGELLFNDAGVNPEGIGGNFVLTGPGGKQISLADYKDKIVLLYFGYTSCPDVCPASMLQLKLAMQELADDSENVQGIFVSVDPERDYGERLQSYVQYFHPGFIGLTGSAEEIRKVSKQWSVEYQRLESTSALSYLIAHTDYIFVLDKDQQLAAIFTSSSNVEDIVDATKVLIKEL
jgi:protein SCO1/2